MEQDPSKLPTDLQFLFDCIEFHDFPRAVQWLTNLDLAIASRTGVSIHNTRLDQTMSAKMDHVHDIAAFLDRILVVRLVNNCAVLELCSLDLQSIERITDFHTNTRFYLRLATIGSRVFISSSDAKILHVYNKDKDLYQEIELSDMECPCGICSTGDRSLLITDYTATGSLRKCKYTADGVLLKVWTCYGLQNPIGVSESDCGVIYVKSSLNGVVYQISSDGVKLREMTCPIRGYFHSYHDISVSPFHVAVAHENVVKVYRFKYIFTPKSIASPQSKSDSTTTETSALAA